MTSNNWPVSLARISEYFEKQNGKITLGVDGFVDEVWQLVESRKSADDYRFFEKMSDYANSILARGTGGISYERVLKRRTYGGFASNTGQAAGQLGCNLTMIGMFETRGETDPVFQSFTEHYNAFSIGESVLTVIYEFADGKIMISQQDGLTERSWEQMVNAVTWDGLRSAYEEAEIVGFGYFSQKKYAYEDIIEKLIENFLEKGKCCRMLLDFGNIQKFPKSRMMDALQTLAALNKRLPLSLSLNEHEGKTIFSFVGKDFRWDEPLPGAEEDIAYVRREIGLDEIIVHTPAFAIAASASEGTACVRQRYCENPVITTGAGDNFNGGYLAACLQKGMLSLPERLFVANATTGCYVRHGVSPDKTALMEEMAEVLKMKLL